MRYTLLLLWSILYTLTAQNYIQKDITIPCTLPNKIAGSLQGKLMLPTSNTNGSIPLIILIQGSGATDSNETIGSNKPFKDIAIGLANKGIATLRYNKKNYQYNRELSDVLLSPDAEIVDDAITAIQVAHTLDNIDKNAIFVAGHSLGGYLLPKIVKNSDMPVAGMVLLAAPARSLENTLLEQNTYILSLDGLVKEEELQLKILEKQLQKVKKRLNPNTPNTELPLGLPAEYWLYMKKYKATKGIRKLKKPTLVIQAENDYQVTMKDFNTWKKALKRNKKAKLISYPGLFHLLMPSQNPTKATPKDYSRANKVSPLVIEDIAKFILENK